MTDVAERPVDVNAFLNAAPVEKPEPVVQNRQYVIPRGGDRFTRCTTFASTLDDRFALERWQQRMVASGLVLRADLHVQVAANIDDRDELNALCDQAIEAAKGKAGANVGTALHALAEQVDRGETPIIPAPFDADIAAYTATLEQNGVRVDPALMEGIVVCRDLRVAGRFDRIVRVDGYPMPLIADLKTGSISHSLTTIATQLAIYANADELYDPITDALAPMPRVDLDQALIIHLPAGEARCDLYFVNIRAGWEAAQLCKQVRDWRRTDNLARKFESTATERARWLAARVATIKAGYPEALAELAARWPAGVPTFKQGSAHTDEQLSVLAALLNDVEARHTVEFGDPDPARRRPAPQIVDALIGRAAALPADLLEVLENRCKAAGVPQLRSRGFLLVHVEFVDDALGEIEAMHGSRREGVAEVMREITDGDVDLIAAVTSVCGADGAWTRAQVDLLAAVRDGFSNLWLGYGETDGVITVTTIAAEERLVEWFGAKRDALAASKQIAEASGLDKPRAVADVAGNPALFALVATSATTQASTNQGAAA